VHVVIDDTYGPELESPSKFVTGQRRSHLAVVFEDSEVEWLRRQIKECLETLSETFGEPLEEFHFSELYNRKNVWAQDTDGLNLQILEFFADRYRENRWPVYIQTVDNRTFNDHGFDPGAYGVVDSLDLAKREDQSLFFLLVKLKKAYLDSAQTIHLYVDEGRRKSGTPFPKSVFHNWPAHYEGGYYSSKDEPLLQIADFLAFAVNRSTHLALKAELSDTDIWFLNLVASMSIDCKDLQASESNTTSLIEDFERLHGEDRRRKGIRSLE
jgi:hypothetical protein